MIQGVEIINLKRIQDERGCIFHMLRSDDPHFEKFGEIYFSTTYSNAIKGWHKHEYATLNYAVIYGTIKLVLYDDRKESTTKGELMELFIGENNYCLVKIPPGIWNGFKAVGNNKAIVANCCTHAHGTFKSERMSPENSYINYDWKIKNE
ncbi:MAG: dTDP-4-dehydrorhamnose 3,5-epimerase family protein [Nanoarchaeota archaeon]